MAVAMIYPVRTPRGKSSVSEGISYERVSAARTVLRHAPDLAPNVKSGSTSLDAAYKVASDLKLGATGEIKRLAHLRKSYPELADKVVEGKKATVSVEKISPQRLESSEPRTARSRLRGQLGSHPALDHP